MCKKLFSDEHNSIKSFQVSPNVLVSIIFLTADFDSVKILHKFIELVKLNICRFYPDLLLLLVTVTFAAVANYVDMAITIFLIVRFL